MMSIDNGGRFFNLLTRANDGNISASELGKVAGVLGDKQKMVLFLEMSLSKLSDSSVSSIRSALSSELKQAYRRYQPRHYSPTEANKQGVRSQSAIVTGVPKFVKANSDFTGFIMIPMVANGITTMMMIPMIDHYDVYEIRDEETDEDFLIAHARSAKNLPQVHCCFGGILKELKSNNKNDSKKRVYLNTIYYSVVDK